MPDIILTLEQVAQLSGQTPEALTTQISDENGGIDAAKALDVLNKGIASKRTKYGEDRYQVGWKQSRAALEGIIKDQFGITDFEKAEEALEALKVKYDEAQKAGSGKFDPAKLTPEQLAGIPAFQTATEQLRQAMELAAKERDAAKSAFDQYRTMQTAKAQAEALLESKNAHYGSAGKDRALSLLFTDLTAQGFNLSVDDAGNLSVLDKEGKVAVDEYHNPLKFEAIVEKTWPFGFNVAPDGRNPNPPGKETGAGGGGGGASKYASWSIDKLTEAAKDPQTPTSELAQIMGAIADKQRQGK